MASNPNELQRLRELLNNPARSESAGSDMSTKISVGHGAMDWPAPSQGNASQTGDVKRSLLLTVPEACAELRVSRAQLYVLANKQHAIEMVHIGKLSRIPRDSIEGYVQQLREKAQSGLASRPMQALES